MHDMPWHLFVVSEDLLFSHIHPVQQSDGRFTIEMTVPNAERISYKRFFSQRRLAPGDLSKSDHRRL